MHDPDTCTERGKHPATKWGTAATTDPSRIVAEFSGVLRNVGLTPPVGWIVIDEDSPGGLAKAAADQGQDVPPTLTWCTGRGRHYVYALPPGELHGNQAGRLKSDYGCDVRGPAGYVVGPSSVHATGVVYELYDPDAEVAAAPRWLLDLIRERPADTETGRSGGLDGVPAVIAGPRPGQPGQRHEQLVAYACSLRAREIPAGEAEVLFRAAWARCEQPPVAETPLTWEEARDKLTDVYRRYPAGRSAGYIAPEIAAFIAPEQQISGDEREQWVRENLRPLDWEALWADDTEDEWILEPLLPARRLVALYSPPKVGKSLLLLELAVAVSRGADALGTSTRKSRVLYVDFENDPRGDVRERLRAMGHTPAELADLVYLSFPTLAELDGEAGSLQLLAAIETYACEVVIIDTVSRSVKGDENENDTWLRFYRHTGLKLKQAGVSLVRLDHSGKDEAKGQRGGSAKVGDVDAVWKMTRVSDDLFRLECEANRFPVAEKTLTLRRIEHPDLYHRVEPDGFRAQRDAVRDAAMRACMAAGLPANAGRDRVKEAVRGAGIKMRNDALGSFVAWRKLQPVLSVLSVPEIGDSSRLLTVPNARGQVGTGEPA
jgi:hypothetical protein